MSSNIRKLVCNRWASNWFRATHITTPTLNSINAHQVIESTGQTCFYFRQLEEKSTNPWIFSHSLCAPCNGTIAGLASGSSFWGNRISKENLIFAQSVHSLSQYPDRLLKILVFLSCRLPIPFMHFFRKTDVWYRNFDGYSKIIGG
jgi:hypothetical protein